MLAKSVGCAGNVERQYLDGRADSLLNIPAGATVIARATPAGSPAKVSGPAPAPESYQ